MFIAFNNKNIGYVPTPSLTCYLMFRLSVSVYLFIPNSYSFYFITVITCQDKYTDLCLGSVLR